MKSGTPHAIHPFQRSQTRRPQHYSTQPRNREKLRSNSIHSLSKNTLTNGRVRIPAPFFVSRGTPLQTSPLSRPSLKTSALGICLRRNNSNIPPSEELIANSRLSDSVLPILNRYALYGELARLPLLLRTKEKLYPS
jgi:hypothetical protein